jgi:CheY-like chemotaxis protein
LIVDDEEVVRKVGIKLLQHLGYTGIAVNTKKDAIKSYREAKESKSPFDFVILDLTLPNGVTGIQIFEELKKIEPGVKAIISTGYVTHPILENYRDYGFQGVLIKPYTSNDFEKMINQIYLV